MELKAKIDNICTGCMACVHVCPEECIGIEYDTLGFAYPNIDNNKCIDCNACNTVCPAIKERKDNEYKFIMAAKADDDTIRLNSSSGGVFSLLAATIINNGGVVFGAKFDKNMKLSHYMIDSIKDIPSLQGSKYLQSDISNCYSVVKRYLSNNKQVLFVGTPCQVDGIRSHFDTPSLITCAIVCHGVPSNAVFDGYVKSYEKQIGKLSNISFRDKQSSWRRYHIVAKGENGKEIATEVAKDSYMKGFIEGYYMRDCCHNCPSKPVNADILLGDYWGVENYHPEMDDDMGVSMVYANEAGCSLLFSCNALVMTPTEYEDTIKYNKGVYSSAKPHPKRDEFIKYFNKRGYKRAIKKYLTPDTRVQYVIKKSLDKLGIIEY